MLTDFKNIQEATPFDARGQAGRETTWVRPPFSERVNAEEVLAL